MQINIASYNIHKGVSAFGRHNRIHDIKEAIQALDADLIFLQEVQGQHDLHARRHALWPQQGQHEFLAGSELHSAYGMNAVYQHGHHGNALLSRFPIHFCVNHDVSDHRYEQRGILHAVVHRDGIAIHCFVIHLGLFAASRRRQVQALIDTIQRDTPADCPLIIAGDFNDWTQSLSQILYRQLAVSEVFDLPEQRNASVGWLRRTPGHARTFPAGFPWLCLDRVYLRGFQVSHAEVKSGSPWNRLSDHVPITARLQYLSAAVPTAA